MNTNFLFLTLSSGSFAPYETVRDVALFLTRNMHWLAIYIALNWIIRVTMVPVLLRREFAPGAAIAWLGVIFLHPYIGLALYMTVGETRLGPRRAALKDTIAKRIRAGALTAQQQTNRPNLHREYDPMILQAEKISGLPTVGGNTVDFISNSSELIDRLIESIEAAQSEVHLLYFIFATDDTARKVADAICRAAKRGVNCRLLADAVASRKFFHRGGLRQQLLEAGVHVIAALPVAPFRRRLPRVDLRNHRKLAIIDGKIAFVGSQNMINADYNNHRGGPWFDLTAKVTGPVVSELAMVFAEDWAFETGTELPVEKISRPTDADLAVSAQVVPTGPSSPANSFRRVLLAAVQCAQSRIILTTPYFVPDEPTIVALLMAADRGVEVSLVVPAKPDQIFTAAAGRAHFTRLMEAGVKIFQYQPGLLHAKTTTVDESIAIIGSANLDVRSFNINFELSLLLYGAPITKKLRDIQTTYLHDSRQLDLQKWNTRSKILQYTERALSLLSPLL